MSLATRSALTLQRRTHRLIAAALVLGAGWAPSARANPYVVSDLQVVSGPAGLPETETCSDFSNEAETYLASQPGDPDHLVAVWGVETGQDPDKALGTASVGAVSRDGGATWTRSPIPGAALCTEGTKDYVVDSWVSVGPDGAAYYATYGIASDDSAQIQNEVYAARSLGGGEQWDKVKLLDGPVGRPVVGIDRTSNVADPRVDGHAFTLWTRIDHGIYPGELGVAGIFLSETTDGGVTWLPPSLVTPSPPPACPECGPSGKTAAAWQLVVLPDDSLLVFYSEGKLLDLEPPDPTKPPEPPEPAPALARRGTRSTDGSWTWSEPVRVATLPEYALPRVALAPDGTVYFTYAERLKDALGDPLSARIRVVEIHSTDAGITGSEPRDVEPVPFDDSNHAKTALNEISDFEPRIAVASDGTVGVAWYDQRNRESRDGPATTDVWFAHSHDRGQTWEPIHLAGPFDLNTGHLDVIDGPIGAYQGIAPIGTGFGVLFVQAKGKWSSNNTKDLTDVYFAKVVPLPEPESSVQLMAGVATLLGVVVCRSRRAGCEMR